MKIKRNQTTAVCIDYQERILPAMFGKEELLEKSKKLLEGLKVLQVPICLTQQYTKGLGTTVPEICEAAGTEEYLEKVTFSAYEQVKEKLMPPEEMPYVIICGIESHVCVLQTAIDLKNAGYQPYLVTDCISSRKQQDYDMALERAKQEGIILTTYESILFELLGAAGTPDSKAIQKIVK